MLITDHFDHVIDDKGRLAIPSEIRNRLDTGTDGPGFYLVPEEHHLQLFTAKFFKRMTAQMEEGLAIDPDVAKARRFAAYFIAYAEPDKQGRVIIPERFMKDSKNHDARLRLALLREVALVGTIDHVEVWNRKDLELHLDAFVADGGTMRSAMTKGFKPPPPPAPSATSPAAPA